MLFRDSSDRDVVCYVAAKKGYSTREIASAFGLSQSTVMRAISREDARRRLPEHSFEILLPQHFTPESPCPHTGHIPDGQRSYCTVCHESGWDGHKDMVITEMPPDPPCLVDDGSLAGGLG